MRLRHHKYLLSLLVAVCLLFPGTVLAGDATGADEIFVLIGQDKPPGWATWSQDKKFDFLQEMELYPPAGQHKYKGQIDGLDGYFEWLGTEQPADWLTMTFAERKEIVSEARQPAPKDVLVAENDLAQLMETTPPPPLREPSNLTLKIILALAGLALGGAIIFVSYKIDYWRANKSK